MKKGLLKIFLLSVICFSQLVTAQDLTKEKPQESTEALQKLANPISNLMNVTFQNNTDFSIGPNSAKADLGIRVSSVFLCPK